MFVMHPTYGADIDEGAMRRLKDALAAAGYTRETVQAALRADQQALPQPGEMVVFEHRVAGHSPRETLIRFFLIGSTVEQADLAAALPGMPLEELHRQGVAQTVPGGVRCPMRIVPHGDVIVASDRTYYKDGGGHDSDVVMGVSNPAILLANLTIRKPVNSALDLGTGGGIQALLMANHCERVVATDLNPRALEITRFNAALNGFLNIETRAGSWFEPVAGERFDIIAANPPYVISPESTFLYRDSGMPADSLSRQLVREMPQHLEEGGFGHILVSWGVAANQDPLEPARKWVEGLPCDVWLLHYLTDDPLTQASKWNRPLAMEGLDAYSAAIDRWLAYYREHGIERIAFGALIMRRRSQGSPWLRADTLHTSRASAGLVLRIFKAEDFLRGPHAGRLGDERLALVPNHELRQRLVAREGAWQLDEATLTLTEGLGFRGGLDVATAQVLQHLDGKHSLSQAVDQASRELGFDEEDRRALAEASEAMARRLFELGFLVRGESAPPPPDRPLAGTEGFDPTTL
jgi:methylase of polypeptide subunit release factors